MTRPEAEAGGASASGAAVHRYSQVVNWGRKTRKPAGDELRNCACDG